MNKALLDVCNSCNEKYKMPFYEVLKSELARLEGLEYDFEVIKALVVLKRSELIKKIRNLQYYVNLEKEIVIDENLKLSPEENDLIDKAIAETKGIIVLSGDKAVDLHFTKCCGGGTANSEDVMGYRVNYLRKILCKHCDAKFDENVMKVYDIAVKLNLPNVSYKEEIGGLFSKVSRDETGRIININVMGKTISGEEFAKLVSANSSRIYFQENSISFKSVGEGNGLGLCLSGAQNLVKNGLGYKEIIQYYYTGVQFIELDINGVSKNIWGKCIIIDPGHGGNDVGNTIGYINEKDINLIIATELEKKLQDIGMNVVLTRDSDVNVPSIYRINLINEKRPDLFISIHQNSIMFHSINGVEIYCYENDNDAKKLGECIEYFISQDISVKNRGIKFGDYHLLRETKVSGLILECMYMSGDQDSKKYTEEYYPLIANAIYKGICKFYGIEE